MDNLDPKEKQHSCNYACIVFKNNFLKDPNHKERIRPLKYGKNFLSLKIFLPALVQMPLQGGIHDMYIPLQKLHTRLNYAMK